MGLDLKLMEIPTNLHNLSEDVQNYKNAEKNPANVSNFQLEFGRNQSLFNFEIFIVAGNGIVPPPSWSWIVIFWGSTYVTKKYSTVQTEDDWK